MAETRKEIIEQLQNLRFVNKSTQTSNILENASLNVLNSILDQVKKNGPQSSKAKQIVQKQAIQKGGSESANAVHIQLNDKQLSQKISDIRQVQFNLDDGDSQQQIKQVKNQIQNLVVSCQKGNEEAIKFLKNLNLKDIKGIKNASVLLKQLNQTSKKTGISLNAFSKTQKNVFSQSSKNIKNIGDIKKTFKQYETSLDKVSQSVKKFSGIDLKGFATIGAGSMTAVKSLNSLYKNIDDVTKKIIDYHKNTQVIGSSNTDLMPGGAKQLDNIRRQMNLTRDETVEFAKTVSALRGTTYSFDDVSKAMEGMKKTIGQVDVNKLQTLSQVMKTIPKQQLDSFTSGSGSQVDTMNAIMNMQKNGATQKVLQLGASGAFGSQFAQASGVKINQNQKNYINNKRAVKTSLQTMQNSAQQSISNTPILGKLMANTMPIANGATQLQGLGKAIWSFFDTGQKKNDGNKQKDTSIQQSKSNQKLSIDKKQKDNQKLSIDKKQNGKDGNITVLKSIDRKITGLLRKKYQISNVNKVKQVDKVKHVGKLKQSQFLRSVKTVNFVKNINGNNRTQNVANNIIGKTKQTELKPTDIIQKGTNAVNKLFTPDQKKSDNKSSNTRLQKTSIGQFDLSSLFDGKISDSIKGLKLQDVVHPQNISNLLKGKLNIKQLKNQNFSKYFEYFKYFKNFKQFGKFKNLINLKSLLKVRNIGKLSNGGSIGKAIIKSANAFRKGYKAVKAAKGAAKAVAVGKTAFNVGRAALSAAKINPIVLAASTAIQAAIGGVVKNIQDQQQASNIKKQMGIQQNVGGIDKIGKFFKQFDMNSFSQGALQAVTFGLMGQSGTDKKQRQIQMASKSQTKYDQQTFVQLANIYDQTTKIRKSNIQRNQYMAKQYASFSKKLDIIKSGQKTISQRLRSDISSKKMDSAFNMNASNSDYNQQSKNLIQNASSQYSVQTKQLSKMKSEIMNDNRLTQQQRVTELLQIEGEQIQIRKQFIQNLKKAFDCKNIPSIIQNGFYGVINAARIQGATIGYGGDDEVMIQAMGDEISRALDNLGQATVFNAQVFGKFSQQNNKRSKQAINTLNQLSGSNTQAAFDKISNTISQNIISGQQTFIKSGSNDGFDIKAQQLQFGNRRLSKQQIDALRQSGLADDKTIYDLEQGNTLSQVSGQKQLNNSMTQSAKDQGLKKLFALLKQQRQKGDVKGATGTQNIIKGIHKAMKARGATTQSFDKLAQNLNSNISQQFKFKNNKGIQVDYSKSFQQQDLLNLISDDPKFLKLLQQRNLADQKGNITTNDSQMLQKAYNDRKISVASQKAYDNLSKDKSFQEALTANNGDQQKAFKQYMSEKQKGVLKGIDKSVLQKSNNAIQNAVSTGEAGIQFKNNKQNMIKVFDLGISKAQSKEDKDSQRVLQQAKQAVQRLTSGQKISLTERKKLIAKIQAANTRIGVIGQTIGDQTRASQQTIIAVNQAKNAQLKVAQFMSQTVKNQTDQYSKLINSIQSLQNAIAKSSSVKRAQLKSNLVKSQTALVQFGGGDIGKNLSDVYKSVINISKQKSQVGTKALEKINSKQYQQKIKQISNSGGQAYDGQLKKVFKEQFRKTNVDSNNRSFSDVYKSIGDLAKQGANTQDFDKQDSIREKILQQQKILIQAINKNQKSGKITKEDAKMQRQLVHSRSDQARQMIGTKGTIQGVQLKIQTQINQALSQQINALKNFGSSLKTASNSLQSLQASSRKTALDTKQKLLKKKLGSGQQSVSVMLAQATAVQEQYNSKKKMQQTKIDATQIELQKAQIKYSSNPTKENKDQLLKAQFANQQAKQGMDAINIQQYQNANKAVSGALQIVAVKAQLAQQKLSIMQDQAQNVAGTTAQWYRLQNQKLNVMAKQVKGMRQVIKSQAFAKLSNQQRVKYTNELAKKQLAMAKQRIGAQRTVFEKQLGAILGGFQSQGAFQGFNNAAVFGIGHGINQAGMATQRKNMQGGGYATKTLGHQDRFNTRTQFSTQGATSMQQAGNLAQAMGTPKANNLIVTKNKDGSFKAYDKNLQKYVSVGKSVKTDANGNAVYKTDVNGNKLRNEKGQFVVQEAPQSSNPQTNAGVQQNSPNNPMGRSNVNQAPQDNTSQQKQLQRKAKEKQEDLRHSDHQIYVDLLGTVRDILDTIKKLGVTTVSSNDKSVKTGANVPKPSGQNGGQGQTQPNNGQNTRESNTTGKKGNAQVKRSNATGKPQTTGLDNNDYGNAQLKGLIAKRNSTKDVKQKQKLDKQISEMQSKLKNKPQANPNGGVASQDKPNAGQPNTSVDNGASWYEGSSTVPSQQPKQQKNGVQFVANQEYNSLNQKNKNITQNLKNNNKKLQQNKNRKQALKKKQIKGFDAKKVETSLKNYQDQKDNLASLQKVSTQTPVNFQQYEYDISDESKLKQLADNFEKNGAQNLASLFRSQGYKNAVKNKGTKGGPNSTRADYSKLIALVKDAKNKDKSLIAKKIKKAKQDALRNGLSQKDLNNPQAIKNKINQQNNIAKQIADIDIDNSRLALDNKRSSQMKKFNSDRMSQIQKQQTFDLNTLAGNNPDATVQQKQKALDNWNSMTAQQKTKSNLKQQNIDDFVRNAVRNGDKLNFDNNAQKRQRIKQQHKDQIDAKYKSMMGDTTLETIKSNKPVSKEYAKTLQQVKKQYKGKKKFDNLSQEDKFNLVQQYAQKKAQSSVVDPLMSKTESNEAQKNTRQNKVAQHERVLIAQQNLQKQNAKLPKQQQVTDQQVSKAFESEGKDISTMSDYDIKNKKSVLIMQKKHQQAKKKAEQALKKVTQNPNDQKALQELSVANAQVKKYDQNAQKQFLQKAQKGRQIQIQKTTKSNQTKMDAAQKAQQNKKKQDKKLVQLDQTINKPKSYAELKKHMMSKGMTQQQFEKSYGKQNGQTQQQIDNMKKLQDSFKDQAMNQAVQNDAKSAFQKAQDARAKKAAQQGIIVMKESWQTADQATKQKYRDQQKPILQKKIQQAKQRQQQRTQKQGILSQNTDRVSQQTNNLLSKQNIQATKKQAAQHYKSQGIDFNGATQQQQKELVNKFAKKKAQNNVVQQVQQERAQQQMMAMHEEIMAQQMMNQQMQQSANVQQAQAPQQVNQSVSNPNVSEITKDATTAYPSQDKAQTTATATANANTTTSTSRATNSVNAVNQNNSTVPYGPRVQQNNSVNTQQNSNNLNQTLFNYSEVGGLNGFGTGKLGLNFNVTGVDSLLGITRNQNANSLNSQAQQK